MLFCLFPLLLFSLGCVFVKETNDIIDLANCDGGTEGRSDGGTGRRRGDGGTEGRTEGRTDTTSYRDAEAHLKNQTTINLLFIARQQFPNVFYPRIT